MLVRNVHTLFFSLFSFYHAPCISFLCLPLSLSLSFVLADITDNPCLPLISFAGNLISLMVFLSPL